MYGGRESAQQKSRGEVLVVRDCCARDTKGQFFFGDASFIAKKNRSEARQKSGGLLSEVVRKQSGPRRPGAQKNNCKTLVIVRYLPGMFRTS